MNIYCVPKMSHVRAGYIDERIFFIMFVGNLTDKVSNQKVRYFPISVSDEKLKRKNCIFSDMLYYCIARLQITYASPSWRGFIKVEEIARLKAILFKACRFELWPTFLGSTNLRSRISPAFFNRSPQNFAWLEVLWSSIH